MFATNDPAELKVLLVVDQPINMKMLEGMSRKMGMFVLKVESGLDAVESYKSNRPDLILIDIIKPEVNSHEIIKQIKQTCGDRWVPVLLITSVTSRDEIVNGLEAGADEYISKPLDYLILKTKIINMARVIRQQRELNNYYESAELEREFAIEVMNKLIQPSKMGKRLEYWIKPTAEFSGDVIVAGISSNGNLKAVLADGTGHGLAAALSVIPVVQVFFGMKDKGLTIDEMAKEMNSHIKKVMPIGRFVAATLISMDEQLGTISVWNGGIPFVILIGENGQVLHQWKSNHPFLGLMKEAEFDAGLETYHCVQSGYLFACSDGLLEAEDENGIALDEARLLSWLKDANEDKVKFLQEKLHAYLGDKLAHDDVSFLIAPFTFGGDGESLEYQI
jgi:CheY-like chemotaxis protein